MLVRLSAVHAALAALLLCHGAQGFSMGSSFVTRQSLRSASASVNAVPESASALGLGMVMTAAKEGKSKFPPIKSTSESKPKAAAEVENPEWRMDLPEPVISSDCGADYIPLLTALKLGNYEEADQITRDLLIWIGGEGTRKRGFVYFAEAPRLPTQDMLTIDRLWTTYSKGKFGFSVQKEIWNSKSVKGDFPKFVNAIGWTVGPCGGCEAFCSGCPGTLKRWTPVGSKGNEYVYDLDKAKKGALPLTSALRGTYLLKSLLSHQAFGSAPVLGKALVGAEVLGGPRRVLTGRDAVMEPMKMMEELRFGKSPYTANKKAWDV